MSLHVVSFAFWTQSITESPTSSTSRSSTKLQPISHSPSVHRGARAAHDSRQISSGLRGVSFARHALIASVDMAMTMVKAMRADCTRATVLDRARASTQSEVVSVYWSLQLVIGPTRYTRM
jgi:hypothetical protein